MPAPWITAGSHAAQFYADERYLHRSVATFFAADAADGDSLVMIARPGRLDAVAKLLAAGLPGSALGGAAQRIAFVDADVALASMMSGDELDVARTEQAFARLLEQVAPARADGKIRLYGEVVDVLCQQGNHAAVARLEEIGSRLVAAEPRLSIMCGYAVERFDTASGVRLRSICRQHTHAIAAERGPTPAPDDVTAPPPAERARAFNRLLASRTPRFPAGAAPAPPTVYVIDDDANVRQSLARLLSAAERQVRTFDSAEAFLAGVDTSSGGCLVLDVQLEGMSGLDLQRLLADAGSPWPIVAMSGAERVESDALRLGARAFLRKPFAPQEALEQIDAALA